MPSVRMESDNRAAHRGWQLSAHSLQEDMSHLRIPTDATREDHLSKKVTTSMGTAATVELRTLSRSAGADGRGTLLGPQFMIILH